MRLQLALQLRRRTLGIRSGDANSTAAADKRPQDQEADEAAYNEAMYNGYDDPSNPENGGQQTPTGNKEHVA